MIRLPVVNGTAQGKRDTGEMRGNRRQRRLDRAPSRLWTFLRFSSRSSCTWGFRRWRPEIRQVVLLVLVLVAPGWAETLTLPDDARPEWLRRDGIVMAGSWEPLLFRVRRDGSDGYTPTAEQRAAYLREHSPAMVARLKQLGVNFVMTHCYKGAGLEAERRSMAEAVRFARLCHDQGLRVGVYVYSGAFLWELFFREVPQAEEWVVRDAAGEPVRYGGGRVAYRYYWNRNHPEAEAYYRRIVRFAVEEIRTDLVHFDNYSVGPGYEAFSVARFRQFLRRTFPADQWPEARSWDLQRIQPPAAGSDGLVRYAWDAFGSQSLADSYHAMSRYARSLRPDVLVECNPGGVGRWIQPPRDHGRLLQGGEAFWDEGRQPGFRNGQLHSRIRTYKVARAMNNMAFCYTTTPLEMAEAMAFNRDCLGAVCWFEYARIVRRPGSDEPMSAALAPFIRFFHRRRDLLRDARVVADVAVLRNWASQVFAEPRHRQLTARVEDGLIQHRVPFQILYDHQLDDLAAYRGLVLAGCVALGDEQINKIRAYATAGGRVLVIGPVARYDGWMRPRANPGLTDLPRESVVHVEADADLMEAVRETLRGQLSLVVQGPPGVGSELTRQEDRWLVHLVNYRAPEPAGEVTVRLRLPPNARAAGVRLASPEHTEAPLPFQQEGRLVRFTVPQMTTYEIAVVSSPR